MKHFSEKWFLKDGRKKRITKKLKDKANRSREVMFLALTLHFGRVTSEAHTRSMKAKARRIRPGAKHIRRFNARLLIHTRLGYQATIVMIQEGNVRRFRSIRRSELEWYRKNHLVISASHADGTRETFFHD